jgi:hypothetical protein
MEGVGCRWKLLALLKRLRKEMWLKGTADLRG